MGTCKQLSQSVSLQPEIQIINSFCLQQIYCFYTRRCWALLLANTNFNLIIFFLIQTTTCMWQTKDEMKCENVKWKMWWYEEDFECIMKLTRIHWIAVSLFRQLLVEDSERREWDWEEWEWERRWRGRAFQKCRRLKVERSVRNFEPRGVIANMIIYRALMTYCRHWTRILLHFHSQVPTK